MDLLQSKILGHSCRRRVSHAAFAMSAVRLLRFERVTFAIGGNANQSSCPPLTEIEGLASIWMSHDGFQKRLQPRRQFSAVAQMVGFGLRRSKMLYLSMGVD